MYVFLLRLNYESEISYKFETPQAHLALFCILPSFLMFALRVYHHK